MPHGSLKSARSCWRPREAAGGHEFVARWAGALTDGGFEAVHWAVVGKANARDTEIMAYAKAHQHIVLTHDLDFSAMLAANHGEKPSVVQIRSIDVSPT